MAICFTKADRCLLMILIVLLATALAWAISPFLLIFLLIIAIPLVGATYIVPYIFPESKKVSWTLRFLIFVGLWYVTLFLLVFLFVSF